MLEYEDVQLAQKGNQLVVDDCKVVCCHGQLLEALCTCKDGNGKVAQPIPFHRQRPKTNREIDRGAQEEKAGEDGKDQEEGACVEERGECVAY